MRSHRLKLLSGFIILLGLSVFVGKQYAAHRYYPAEISSLWQNIEPGTPDAELILLLNKAIKQTPSNADYYCKLASLYIKEAIKPSVWKDMPNRKSLIDKAITNAQQAVYLNPSNSRHQIALAGAYALLRPQTFHVKAFEAFEKASYLNPSSAMVLNEAGSYYLNSWRILSPTRQAKAIAMFGRVIELDENSFDRVFDICWKSMGDYDAVQQIIPENASRHKNFADFLITQGMLKEYAVEMAKVEYLLAERGRRLLEHERETEDVLSSLAQVEGFYHYVKRNYTGYMGESFKADMNSIYARLYLKRAKAQIKMGNYEPAIESLSNAIKKAPATDKSLQREIAGHISGIKAIQDGVTLQLLEARLKYKRNDYSAAVKLLQGLALDSLDPSQRIERFSLLKRCYVAQGRAQEAENVARRIDSLAVKFIKSNSWRGKTENYADEYVYQNGEMYWAGSISTPIVSGRKPREIIIRAKASPAGGIWPVMLLRLDDELLDVLYVRNRQWQDFHFQLPLSVGYQGSLKVSFVNDGGNSQLHEDRNLYVGDVRLCQKGCNTA